MTAVSEDRTDKEVRWNCDACAAQHRSRGMESRTPYQVFKASLTNARKAAKASRRQDEGSLDVGPARAECQVTTISELPVAAALVREFEPAAGTISDLKLRPKPGPVMCPADLNVETLLHGQTPVPRLHGGARS